LLRLSRCLGKPQLSAQTNSALRRRYQNENRLKTLMLITMYIQQSVRFRLLLLVALSLATLPIGLLSQTQRITGDKIPIVSLDNLLQGRVYFSIYPAIQGSQYLDTDWSFGNIQIQDREYKDVPLLYDIYTDDLILLHLQSTSFNLIRLIKEYIQGFNLGDRYFINLAYSPYLETGLNPGFYELLFAGKISLLSKRRQLLKTEDAISSFSRKDIIYLVKDGQAHRISNRKSVVAAIGESHKKSIYSFLKKEKNRLKKANNDQWLRLVKYLNTLQ